MKFAIAKFKYSKDDLYAVQIIEKFDSYEESLHVFKVRAYDTSGGGTWQEAYGYEIIDVKDNTLYYHNGGQIATVFD